MAEIIKPKTGLFLLGFLPQIFAPERGHAVIQLTILGGVCALIGFAVRLVTLARRKR